MCVHMSKNHVATLDDETSTNGAERKTYGFKYIPKSKLKTRYVLSVFE